MTACLIDTALLDRLIELASLDIFTDAPECGDDVEELSSIVGQITIQRTAAREASDIETIRLYQNLADGVSDMVEGGRLTEGLIPDDYQWLANLLAAIAARDPGPTRSITLIRGEFDFEPCSECGANPDGGEGYDGLCGSCADRAETNDGPA